MRFYDILMMVESKYKRRGPNATKQTRFSSLPTVTNDNDFDFLKSFYFFHASEGSKSLLITILKKAYINTNVQHVYMGKKTRTNGVF
jgi:hypothetical protein